MLPHVVVRWSRREEFTDRRSDVGFLSLRELVLCRMVWFGEICYKKRDMAKYHPNKEISSAIEYAIDCGWRFELGGSHRFGCLYCPESRRDGHKIHVHSTPRVAHAHAKDIRRSVDRYQHRREET